MTDPTKAELEAIYRGRPDLIAKQIAARFGFSTAKLYRLQKLHGIPTGRKRQPALLKRPDIDVAGFRRYCYDPPEIPILTSPNGGGRLKGPLIKV